MLLVECSKKCYLDGKSLFCMLVVCPKLPESIYCLHNLLTLDVSNNLLTEVPLLMDQLEKLAENDGLYISNNNLHSPFKEITTQGTQALFEFLKGNIPNSK
jgi:Leucine-rich repeat (LRR) protein